MRARKLANIEHDKKLVSLLVEKCLDMIESCKTKEQMENCIVYIKDAKNFIYAQEHLEEYTKYKLWRCRRINKDNRHEKFISQVNNLFSMILERAILKMKEL